MDSCVRWGYPLHIAAAFIAVTLTSVTVLVKPLQKCSRHAAVSEVEPPPESRSGQKKVRRDFKKVVGRTEFQGEHDGRGFKIMLKNT